MNESNLPVSGLMILVRNFAMCGNDQDIVILPADKGNATVVMDCEDYVGKINEMLKDGAYGKSKKDPTTAVESKVHKMLRRWERDEHINRKFQLSPTPMLCTTSAIWPPRNPQGGNAFTAYSLGHWVPHIQHCKIRHQNYQPTDWQIGFIRDSSDFADSGYTLSPIWNPLLT